MYVYTNKQDHMVALEVCIPYTWRRKQGIPVVALEVCSTLHKERLGKGNKASQWDKSDTYCNSSQIHARSKYQSMSFLSSESSPADKKKIMLFQHKQRPSIINTVHPIAPVRAQRIPISLWEFIWRF